MHILFFVKKLLKKNVFKTKHRPGAERCTSSLNGARMHAGCTRSAPGRDPCGLLKGALRLQIVNIYRASSGLRWICDHGRRRNEIRKGPARSRNSTASRRVRKSYGARWICESPFTMYKIFKPQLCYESYLDQLSVKNRKLLAKFRLSSCKLNAITGKYKNNDNNKLCKMCDLNDIEDEFHFVLLCPKYLILRQKYIKPYFF